MFPRRQNKYNLPWSSNSKVNTPQLLMQLYVLLYYIILLYFYIIYLILYYFYIIIYIISTYIDGF